MSVTKRDYYEVLGVDRGCDEQSLKSCLQESWRCSTIPTGIPAIIPPRKNSRKPPKPIAS